MKRSLHLAFCCLAALLIAACAPLAPPAPPTSPGKAELLWLGQSAFRLTTPGGKVIVIDPWLRTNPATPAQYKNLEGLGHVDLILVTHGHFDHIADAPALAQLTHARVYAPGDLNQTLTVLGVLPPLTVATDLVAAPEIEMPPAVPTVSAPDSAPPVHAVAPGPATVPVPSRLPCAPTASVVCVAIVTVPLTVIGVATTSRPPPVTEPPVRLPRAPPASCRAWPAAIAVVPVDR